MTAVYRAPDGTIDLVALRPTGGRSRLVELPADARSVDVPSNLFDAFCGPSPTFVEGAARYVATWPPLVPTGVAVVIAVLVLIAHLRRDKPVEDMTA